MKRVSVQVSAVLLALSVVTYGVELRPEVIVSGKDNYWQTGEITDGGSATVTVNEGQKYQEWQGFAGTFNEAGWDALGALSESDRDSAIKLLFDEENGIGFTWGRIPIGASDYALVRYSLNETADDTGMEHFSLERDENYLIPYIKAAQAVKSDIRFWASPWTPPTWMKSGAASADGFDGGVMRNEPKYLRANALYLARFVEEYTAKGIPIDAICPQNEPGYTQNYPSCGWGIYRKPDNTNVDGTEYLSDFVANYLVSTMQTRCPETDIWFGTLSNDTYASTYWNAAKSKAGSHIKAVGLQWNNSGMVQGIANDGYLVVQSEHQCGNYPWLNVKATSRADATRDNFLETMAPNNHAYGEESWDLIVKWIKAGVNVYSAWNMVLDTRGLNLDNIRIWPQNALLAVDKQAHGLEVTPAYYVFRHIAQYVKPGAIRLGTQGGDALAFLNPDSSIITILFNSNQQPSQVTVSVNGQNPQFTVPGRGWATLCMMPIVSTKKAIFSNQSVDYGKGLKVIGSRDGYRIALPSSSMGAGRIELVTLTGRVLESKAIPQGSREVMLDKKLTSTAGLLLVRVVHGGETRTARIFNAH